MSHQNQETVRKSWSRHYIRNAKIGNKIKDVCNTPRKIWSVKLLAGLKLQATCYWVPDPSIVTQLGCGGQVAFGCWRKKIQHNQEVLPTLPASNSHTRECSVSIKFQQHVPTLGRSALRQGTPQATSVSMMSETTQSNAPFEAGFHFQFQLQLSTR